MARPRKSAAQSAGQVGTNSATTSTRLAHGTSKSSATIGFEAKLWLTADKLRNNMDAAEYKHVVLGLVFLKYISDSFEAQRLKLQSGQGDYAGANPEDPDEYRADNVFWVPQAARWSHLQASAKLPSIGKLVDDAMVALPGQLFYSTQIPVCRGFISKNKHADAKPGLRDRRGHSLFIDARKLGMLTRLVHRELTEDDLHKITGTYHAWRAAKPAVPYQDQPGFCKGASTANIAAHGHLLTPGPYVGAEAVEDEGEPFEEKMPRLVAELEALFAESAALEETIRGNWREMGYGR